MTASPYPSTVVFDGAKNSWIGQIEFEKITGSSDDPPWNINITALGETRSFPVETWEEIAPGLWEGYLWTTNGERGQKFTVRPTLPRDAESAISLQGTNIRIPMPVELLSYIHSSDGGFTMPELYALTDDDGFVATMLLSAPTGLYVRYASMWHDLTDPDVVDGLNVHEVAPTALDLYDERERQGQLPNVTSMLSLEGGDLGITVELIGGDATEMPPTNPEQIVTASGAVVDVPKLKGPDDVEAALAAAADNPEIQWWVERRLRMLGIETELPWS